MRKLLTILFVAIFSMFAMTTFGQGRKFAEVFMGSSNAQDVVNGKVVNYLDSITKICVDKNVMYIAYYQYTGEDKSYWSPDNSANVIFERMNHLNLSFMPDVSLMGKNLMYPYNDQSVILDPTRWDLPVNYTVSPWINSTKIEGLQITINLTLAGTLPASSHVLVALSENLSDASHVFRQNFTLREQNPDGSYTYDAFFSQKYDPKKSEVTVFVEDESTKAVVGAVQVPYSVSVGGYFMGSSGINPISLGSIRVYPNPAREELVITSTTELKSIRVVDVTGKLVTLKTSKDGLSGLEYKMRTDFSSGIYFVSVNDQKPVKIVKQ